MPVKLLVKKLFTTGKSLEPSNYYQDVEDLELQILELNDKFRGLLKWKEKKAIDIRNIINRFCDQTLSGETVRGS